MIDRIIFSRWTPVIVAALFLAATIYSYVQGNFYVYHR